MNRFHLVHVTEFQYDGPVSESYNEVRLRPVHDDRQSCLSFRLTTLPGSRSTSFQDSFGNWVHQFNVLGEHHHLRIEAESVILSHEVPSLPSDGFSLTELNSQKDTLYEEFFDFVAPTAYVPHLEALDELIKSAEEASAGSVAAFARAASDGIHRDFSYVKGATHVGSSIQDSLALRAGVCQDFAHMLLGILRRRGLPARYVSGYLVPSSATEPGAKMEEVIGGQASHAWVEVFVPGTGWVGLDPTLGSPVDLRHVRIAVGRDYGDVAPVRGVYKGHAGQRLSVDVCVCPALDNLGHEQLRETAAGPSPEEVASERAQQHSQQQ
jgi:transglutaminase-like putative cysteine protease